MKHTLMIKTCLITGMKYLCKTTGDPYNYHGSGKRWLNLLKKYHSASPKFGPNAKIETIILGEYETEEELSQAGVYYSKLFDVVKSNQWANLTEEKGTGGWINDQTGKRWKMSESAKENIRASRAKMQKDGRLAKNAAKVAEKISGQDNYQFKGWYETPWGRFVSCKDAVLAAREERKNGNKLVISDGFTIKKYCKIDNTTVINGVSCKLEWKGKTPKELGFGFTMKGI